MTSRAFTHPLTPSGRASLVRPGVYGWGADVLAVYFSADPASLRDLLPPGLSVLDGGCMAYVGEFVSVSEDAPDMAFHDPVGTRYSEAALSIACRHGERHGYFPAFIWVDREWSLIRGWLNGYPKKLADSVILGRQHPLNPLTGSVAAGTRLGATCTRHGRELLRLEIEVERAGAKEDLISMPATFGHRHFPASHPTQTAVSELVEVNREHLVVDDVWRGVGRLELGQAWDEELEHFAPTAVKHAALYSYGFTVSGATVLERHPS